LKVIPVIDVLNGVAVHAVRGERKSYHPLKSVLCTSANPVDVASAFRSSGFKELYLADLDAILGGRANYALYRQINFEAGLGLMIDAGVDDAEKAMGVLEAGASSVIIGTETLTDLDFVEKAVERFGGDRIIVSMDLREGRVISRSEAVMASEPLPLAKTFEEMGVAKIIILDLARVGSERGIDFPMIRQILGETELKILAGGGIRDLRELEEMRSMGVFGALLATILHQGKLKVDELRSSGLI